MKLVFVLACLVACVLCGSNDWTQHLCKPKKGPIDATAAVVRKLQAEDIVEELGNENMNALDKIMVTSGILDLAFCPLVEYVLNEQQNRTNMSIMIDGFYSCNQCDFWFTWNKLAVLYSYRKRFKANFVVLNYTDINCQRRISYYSIGQHTGLINYLPTNRTHRTTSLDLLGTQARCS